MSTQIKLEEFNYKKYYVVPSTEICVVCKYTMQDGLQDSRTQDLFHRQCLEYCRDKGIDDSSKLPEGLLPYCELKKPTLPAAPQRRSLMNRFFSIFSCCSGPTS
jgi:hypothetical protein